MGSRGGYHHGDLRRALLGAALELLMERGAAELSLREVARRAGVSNSAPYHHFPDKAALLAAVGRDGFERLVADLQAAAAGHRTVRDELTAMAEAYVLFGMANPAHYRVMFLPEVKHASGADELQSTADRAFDLLAGRVALVRSGEGDEVHQEIATTIWAALHGISLLAIDGTLQHRFAEPASFIRAATARIIGLVFAPVAGSD